MREVIVPVKPFFAAIDFVPLGDDQSRVKINFLPYPQSQAISEEDFAFGNTCVRAI
jgi:hypothetical protein